jgi:hypothetical protein
MSVLFRPFTVQVRVIPIIEDSPLTTLLDDLSNSSIGLGLGRLCSATIASKLGQCRPESRPKPVLFGLRGTRDSARLRQFHILEPKLCLFIMYCTCR